MAGRLWGAWGSRARRVSFGKCIVGDGRVPRTPAALNLPGEPRGQRKRGPRAVPSRAVRLPPSTDRLMSGLATGRECISTNLADAGLRSVARNNKATRLLTRPGQATKSSAKDLSLRIVKLQSASWGPRLPRSPRRRPARILGQRPIRIRLRCAGENHPVLAWILT